MSRSRKSTPITGITCAESEKRDKQLAARRHRRACAVAIVHGDEMPDARLTGDPWGMAKDGKQWLSPEWRGKGMRK